MRERAIACPPKMFPCTTSANNPMINALRIPKPAGVIMEKKITESDSQGGLKNDRNSGSGTTSKEHEIIKTAHVYKVFLSSLFKVNRFIKSPLYNPDFIDVCEICKRLCSNFQEWFSFWSRNLVYDRYRVSSRILPS